ncbi:hypothetical protein A4H97_28295 [Niastella yeongjuensis]|uniref:NAD-dependent epimerase/dehydratase domain-containing protein n=1 Tax=Niastella yeongjuensis TaxID=354355 RepID=A0A1V9EUT3_9BACT|nr:NAD-dependent epimerase/dehydratase family protein [Niastella yeongjuensis]OQP49792.1 hypothetical protein A4H97_28295 [Niastella yeongjuensis]SEP40285.1 NAD dependent epimerase/dehydratase family protein [Niastella yeongjuensis]
MENVKETVLVTGGSGFIASYCIIALLKKGYKVKASLRSLSRGKTWSGRTARSLFKNKSRLTYI